MLDIVSDPNRGSDVRNIGQTCRQAVIVRLYDRLGPPNSLQPIVGRDPKLPGDRFAVQHGGSLRRTIQRRVSDACGLSAFGNEGDTSAEIAS
ncbi:MAG: hypothetical protein J0G28_13490 [Afipia sp.]|nr:hypothetical protein [Afipia sp.]OJW61441.1 MAG: hypothetical protein BGO65_10510 [Afipia sp. 64-13]